MRRFACWVLICLFAAGYLPARGGACTCTAERNCGCACWKHRPPAVEAGENDDGEARPCCAAKGPRRSSSCGAAHDPAGRSVPAPPDPRSDSHGQGPPMDWLVAAEPARPEAPDAWRRALEARAGPLSNESLEPAVPPP